MKQPSGRQQRILGLVDGYPAAFGGESDDGSIRAGASRNLREMRKRPGHWFLVGQRRRVDGRTVKTGSMAADLRQRGVEAVEVDGKQYARVPGKCGVAIEALVTKQPAPLPSDALPEVTRDRFGWSQNELANAAATARAWLFPIEGIAA